MDEEATQLMAGEQPCQCGQQGPVGWLEHWAVNLALENRYLVAQHHDLDGEVVMLRKVSRISCRTRSNAQ